MNFGGEGADNFLGIENGQITSQRLLDQSWVNATLPPILGIFGAIRVPYPKGLNC